MFTVITIKTDGTSELREFEAYDRAFVACVSEPHNSHFMLMNHTYGYPIGVFENERDQVNTNWPDASNHELYGTARMLFLINGLYHKS